MALISSLSSSAAGGASIKDLTPGSNGYSIEVRLNAEKVTKVGDKLVFRPDPEISEWVMPDNEAIDISLLVVCKATSSTTWSPRSSFTDRSPRRRGQVGGYLDSVRVKGICTNRRC